MTYEPDLLTSPDQAARVAAAASETVLKKAEHRARDRLKGLPHIAESMTCFRWHTAKGVSAAFFSTV